MVKRISPTRRLSSISLALLLTLPACDSQENTGGPGAVEQEADAARAETPDRPKGDQLLMQARYSMVAGSIDAELQQKILASDLPEHARARRILLAMEREGAGLADPDAKPEPEPPRPGVAIPASGQVPQIKAPAPGIEPTEVKTAPKKGGTAPASSTSTSGTSGGGATSGGGEDSTPTLSVLTRLSLRGSADEVTLHLNAADRIVMGMAEQPQSGMLRLVVESAGALPGFLQARPEAHGVKVIDVRRGDDTVQISIQMEEGWRPKGPRSGSTGASLTFVREG